MGVYRTRLLEGIMDVAVIGAGFSGMLAAYLLEKKGINVTIFEKQEYIGGHCKTIVSRDVFTDIGTVFSYTNNIKELLIDLDVDYTEQFIYKKFIGTDSTPVEQMSKDEVLALIPELNTLKTLFEKYSESLNSINFTHIDPELLVPFDKFIKQHKLFSVGEIVKPYLSAFGFGCIDQIQAYYVLKVFNLKTIHSYLNGEKIIFFKKGTTQIIKRLSRNISDIRYSLEVKKIEMIKNRVKIDTLYSSDYFDKVLITTKLPENVIEDQLYNSLMKKIETNPYTTCAYEVENQDSGSTYFKDNLGKIGRIQFFHIVKQSNRSILVAYSYGMISNGIIESITKDIEALNINIKQLITVKQWNIFPHIGLEHLTVDFYNKIKEMQNNSSINFIGSLISEPSIDNLYLSVKESVSEIINKTADNF